VLTYYRKWKRGVKSKALGLMIQFQFGNASEVKLRRGRNPWVRRPHLYKERKGRPAALPAESWVTPALLT